MNTDLLIAILALGGGIFILAMLPFLPYIWEVMRAA